MSFFFPRHVRFDKALLHAMNQSHAHVIRQQRLTPLDRVKTVSPVSQTTFPEALID